MAILRTYCTLVVLGAVLFVTVETVKLRLSHHGSHQLARHDGHNEVPFVRGEILRRVHRQTPAEDSYEDVVEYEYEDEANSTADGGNSTEEPAGKKQSTEVEPEPDEVETGGKKSDPGNNNEEGDEYYDTYDENPGDGENGTNGAGDDEEGAAKAEDEEEEPETTGRDRDKNRARHDDDDADEDSAEREDRLEEERRQAEIREQERLEEERREEERREYERRQEAAEEEEEEDTEEDLRRRHEEERIRAAAEAEAEANRSEEEPEERERERQPPEQRRDEDVDEERNREEDEMNERRVWFVSTTSPTTTTAPPEPEREPEEVEYEETEEEEAPETTQPTPTRPQHEFEEERQHHTDDDERERDRMEFESSSERQPELTQTPIPIEESGREDFERYSTSDLGRRLIAPFEEHKHEEVVEEEEEEGRSIDERQGYEYETTPPSTTLPTHRPNIVEHERHEFGTNTVNQSEETETGEDVENEIDEGTQPPRVEGEEETRVRFVPVVSTTEQTWPYYFQHRPHSRTTTQQPQTEDESEIDESVDERVDEHELGTTMVATTERPYASVKEEDDGINQIQETLDVERTDHHEEDEDEGVGFYEGRRFNEENRATHLQHEDDDEIHIETTHDRDRRPPVVVANLDLSREPDEHEEDHEDDVLLEPSTTRSTTTTTTTRRPEMDEYERGQWPERFDNRIDEDENEIHRNYYGHGRTRPPHHHRPGTGNEYEERINAVDYNVNNRFGETPTRIECFSGYYLSADGTECLDVDECSQNVCGTTQICLNTPGSYRCACNHGFVKDFRDELLCRDINECEIGNGGCGHDCVNTQGSYSCSCSEGYELARDGRNCNPRPTTPTTPTTTTMTTTTTTTTTPPPTTTVQTTPKPTTPLSVVAPDGTRISNCPTPPVPRGSGIAYLYCSRSPVGIHHRHSQLERRLLQDWAARRNRYNTSERVNSRFRLRRTLKRRRHPRQTTYSPGSMCELRCRSGFELKGQYTLHCNATTGLWQGTTTGFCQAIPKFDNKNIGIPVSSSEATPNEIPRISPGHEVSVTDRESSTRPFRPSFRPSSVEIPVAAGGIGSVTTSFRPNFYQLPVTSTSRGPILFTPPPPATRLSPGHAWNEAKHKPQAPTTTTTTTSTTTTTVRPYYNYYSPVTPFRPLVPSTTSTTTPASPTRNSFIHLTYRFKTPWIKCPDDIKIDLQPGQRLAYVIIPQPQTNVDWWRQVTSEPSWAKGLETEIGPGKQKIVFRARTPAPLNNSAECSFVLEVRDIEPPAIRDCPESFSVRLSPGQSARAVTWVEPHFSDNVRVQTIKKSREPGLIMTAGEHVVNYEVSDSSNNRAKCTFTIQVVPSPVSDSRFNSGQSNLYRKPVGTEAVTTTTLNPIKTDLHSTIKNVVCHVGKKGRRIVFQSRVVPRGCTEMPADVVGDSSGMLQNGAGQYNTLNTLVQNSAENSATSQISSVSFSSNDHPQSASAFGQAVSNGRHSNRLVHSTSVVTNGAHGTSSRASSYALSSSRNFDTPLVVTADKQVYDEDFVVPPSPTNTYSNGPKARVSGNKYYNRIDEEQEPRDFVLRSGGHGNGRERYLNPEIKSAAPNPGGRNSSSGRSQQDPSQQDQTPEYRKYFRHFDSWDSAGNRL